MIGRRLPCRQQHNMKANPFEIDGPACISFSGGRTSAFMLRKILDAHNGVLPNDVVVTFANTGKERSETLDFVHECSTRWSVPIRWIEYDLTFKDDGKPSHGWKEVSYQSASRDGQPFETLINVRGKVPNPVVRFCTQELKIRPMTKFARSLGFEHWTNVVGLRADEPRRVAKTKAASNQPFDTSCPLADAGISLDDVSRFWSSAEFDLRLQSYEGNCDLCFLKAKPKLERIMRDRPELAEWWMRQEGHNRSDRKFHIDRPTYRLMLQVVQASPMLPGMGLDEDEDSLPCACTD